MMSGAMRRTAKILVAPAALAVAIVTAACGTQRISVPKQPGQPAQGAVYHGATLFSQRCAGCHTLSYAGTHGSAPNPRDAQSNSGPNFDKRCERPIDRILYAIENGGFSGAYMPQNIVVGEDAVDVAKFVAQYSGRQAPPTVGLAKCQNRPMGTLPANTVGLSAADRASGSAQTSSYTVKHPPARVAAVRGHARAKKHSS